MACVPPLSELKATTVSAPGKLILFGEHSVVYGKVSAFVTPVPFTGPGLQAAVGAAVAPFCVLVCPAGVPEVRLQSLSNGRAAGSDCNPCYHWLAQIVAQQSLPKQRCPFLPASGASCKNWVHSLVLFAKSMAVPTSDSTLTSFSFIPPPSPSSPPHYIQPGCVPNSECLVHLSVPSGSPVATPTLPHPRRLPLPPASICAPRLPLRRETLGR